MEPWRPAIWLLGTWRKSESCVAPMEHANVQMEDETVPTEHTKQNYDAPMVQAQKFLSKYFAQRDLVLLAIFGRVRNQRSKCSEHDSAFAIAALQA